jgi:hypothetical protein
MILDTADTVLGFFGFDRTIYGNPKRNKGSRRKWLWYEELREQRIRDIDTDALILVEKEFLYYDTNIVLT